MSEFIATNIEPENSVYSTKNSDVTICLSKCFAISYSEASVQGQKYYIIEFHSGSEYKKWHFTDYNTYKQVRESIDSLTKVVLIEIEPEIGVVIKRSYSK